MGQVWQELEPKIIKNGFRKVGVYPLNKNAIPDEKFDPDSLQRFLTSKINETQKNVVALSNLCLNILNNVNLNTPAYVICRDETQKTKRLFLKPSEIIIPGTRAGPPGIQVIEDKIIGNNASFKSILLDTIKKSDNVIKVKKRKAAKGCAIITQKYFLEKLQIEAEEKRKKKRKKKRKSHKRN